MKILSFFLVTVYVVLVVGLTSRASHSQTPNQFKKHVEMLLDRISDAYNKSNSTSTFEDDSIALNKLEDANFALSEYLEKTLPKMPQSLTMKFHDNCNRIWVTSSSDHKLRSWAWNTWTGGSMPQISELIEYQTSNGIQTIDPYEDREGGNDSWINEIRTIRSASGHTYYLAISGWKGDGMHIGEQVNVYEIEGTKLNTEVPLFKTKEKTLHEISYYSDGESSNRNRFRLSADGRTFLVPLAIYKTAADKENDDVTLTPKSLKYEFDGEHFVYRGVTKHQKDKS